jgi:hypothetical protein
MYMSQKAQGHLMQGALTTERAEEELNPQPPDP